MNLMKLLPIEKGTSFSEWAERWLKEVKVDVYSIIEDDADAIKRRNERLSAYLAYLSTLIAIYRAKAREVRDKFHLDNPKPQTGIKEWEERRDKETAQFRYMMDFLVNLREDIQRRVSVAQTALNYSRAEVTTFGSSD